MPAPEAGWRSTPCQLGMKRASARWSAGSISLRRAASEARRSRRSTSGSHHSRCVPPGRSSPRTSSPARSRPASTRRQVEPVALLERARLERAVGAGVAAHEPLHRVGDVLEEDLGQTGGRHRAERVAVEAGVLGGDPARLAADAQPHGAALAVELPDPFRRAAPRVQLVARVRSPTPAQDVVQRVDESARVRSDSRWRSASTCSSASGVDQLAQLVLAEQLAQQVAVEREGGRAALRVRRVALVHVGRDVVEQQRGGERARRSASRPRRGSARASAGSAAARAGRGRRARRAGTRGRSRARSGTGRSAWRPRAATGS